MPPWRQRRSCVRNAKFHYSDRSWDGYLVHHQPHPILNGVLDSAYDLGRYRSRMRSGGVGASSPKGAAGARRLHRLITSVWALALIGGCSAATTQPAGNDGVTASSESLNAVIGIRVNPTEVRPGGTLTVSPQADTTEAWIGGVAAYFDAQVSGEWVTLWGVIADEWGSEVHRFSSSQPTWEVLGVGVAYSMSVVLPVPPRIVPGNYRICRTYSSPEPTRSVYLCTPVRVVQ